jgi:putative two-component system response regulator
VRIGNSVAGNTIPEYWMRVLAVEDDCVSAEILRNSLERFGYDVTIAGNGREAFELIRSGCYRLVVSDWEMPEMNGLALCRQIRKRQGSGYIYVILVTSYNGVENVVEALNAGADDFLSKPFQPEELHVRLRTGERILSLESRDVVIFALARLAESRDSETGAHLERIREYCRILGEELSQWDKYRREIDGEYVQLLYLTSPLHDIGKVGIPDRVLLKPGRLTPEEFEIMKRHAVIGGNTLEAAARAHPEAQFLTMAREIALSHHERYDGTGYPRGLGGDEIPLCGRITAVADVYDALTSQRVYKPRISHQAAREIILDGWGTQFDPDVVEAFLRHEEDFVAVGRRFDELAVSEDESRSLLLPEPAGA